MDECVSRSSRRQSTAGKDAFDTRAERALAERAVGYSVDVGEYFVINGKVVKRTVRKYYRPDGTAASIGRRIACQIAGATRRGTRSMQRPQVREELRQLLAAEFQDLIDQGLLMLPDRDRKMKEINPKSNGHGDT